MFHRIEDFAAVYGHESQLTAKVLGALTDEALSREKTPGDLTTGALAWHVATAPNDIVNQFGCDIPVNKEPEQLTAQAIADEYARTSAATIEQVRRRFKDADLAGEVSAYGFPMPLGGWLGGLISHEIHHRGQLSVLLRQAGLTVPSIYGPNKEETAKYMAEMANGGK